MNKSDIHAYVICNDDTEMLSIVLISAAKYDSANSNMCDVTNMMYAVDRALCK